MKLTKEQQEEIKINNLKAIRLKELLLLSLKKSYMKQSQR